MEGRFWYVYMLRSECDPHRRHAGMAEDVLTRLHRHNGGQARHTSKFVPWRIETAMAFRLKDKAVGFEKHLKSHSGRAFAERHF